MAQLLVKNDALMAIMDLTDGVANAHHLAKHAYHSINAYLAQNIQRKMVQNVWPEFVQLANFWIKQVIAKDVLQNALSVHLTALIALLAEMD